MNVGTHAWSQAGGVACEFGQHFDRVAGWIYNGTYFNHFGAIPAQVRALDSGYPHDNARADPAQEFLGQGHTNAEWGDRSDPEQAVILYDALHPTGQIPPCIWRAQAALWE